MMNGELLNLLEDYFSSSELNHLPQKYGGGRIFSNPLIGVASGSDNIFQKYKEYVGLEHLTPLELWISSKKKEIPEDQLRTISIVFPYSQKIREEGQKPIKLKHFLLPSEFYSVGRNYANEFIASTLKKTNSYFEDEGFNGVGGVLSDTYTVITKGRFYSTWSERHIAFAAGLGTFSLHEGFISDVGCNIRLGSVVTDAPLEITPRKSDEPYSNCLFYAKSICKECTNKCPANAITTEGHDKALCNNYRMKVSRRMVPRLTSILKPHTRNINGEWREKSFPVGCAFCQFGVPCMDKNPTKN
jgi:epoxyqueuosine reductase QueG